MSPADEQPDGEEDDQRGDRGLGSLLHPLGDVALGEEDRDAEEHERDPVTDPPPGAETRGGAYGPVAAGRDERRHRGEVVRVGGVPEPEQDTHEQDDGDGAPSENPAIQSSIPNMSLVRRAAARSVR